MSDQLGQLRIGYVVKSWRLAAAAGIPVHHESTKRNKGTKGERGRMLRRVILRLQQGLCLLCGNPVVEPSLEHMIPLEHGGSNRVRNLAVSCTSCNNKRQSVRLTEEQCRRAVAWFLSPDGDRRVAAVADEDRARAREQR